MGVVMVNEPDTATEGDEQPEVTPEPDTETVVAPEVPAEVPAEEPAPEELAAEPEEQGPPVPDPESTLNVVTTDGVFGYVTISGVATDVYPPLALRVTGDASTRWFAQTFPVNLIHGEFAMTIHLPPGGHTAELFDREHKHASATFNVV